MEEEEVVDVDRRTLLDEYQDETADVTVSASTLVWWPRTVGLLTLDRRTFQRRQVYCVLWLCWLQLSRYAWLDSQRDRWRSDECCVGHDDASQMADPNGQVYAYLGKDAIGDDGLQVAFTLDNYGKRWGVLLSLT